ncbi:MAG: hypothetical protein H7Z13_19620 [Ferruginibacter sp.]|nr:hypothetical protein [Ferruginibacter sp.]
MNNPIPFIIRYFYKPGYKFSFVPAFSTFIKLSFILNPLVLTAQKIIINSGCNVIIQGNLYVLANNTAFENNGVFTAGTGAVKFTGNADTAIAYVAGNSNTAFYNLSIDKTAYGIALKSTVSVQNILKVSSGNLYTDSNLTLLSVAALTARVDTVPSGANILGKVMVERYIPARRAWRLMTAPVTEASTIYNTWQNRGVYAVGKGMLISGPPGGNGLDRAGSSSLKKFNTATGALADVINTNTPISATNTGNADNTGYFVFIRGDRNTNNFIVPNTNTTTIAAIGRLQTGTQNFSASSVYGGFTLIGNPFASPVDFGLIGRTNLLKRFYAWDPSLNTVGGYIMLDDLDENGIYSKSVVGSQQNQHIQSAQAFYVETDLNATAILSVSENAKSSSNNNLVFRPQIPAGNEQVTETISTSLYLLNPDGSLVLADGVFSDYNNAYHAAVTREDASKFTNVNENLAIVRNTALLALERRPIVVLDDTVFLKLWKTTQRSYQLEFVAAMSSNIGLTAFLIDSYLHTSTPLNTSGTTNINFVINSDTASTNVNRFMVVFNPLNTLPVNFTSVTAIRKGEQIVVEWNVQNEINVAKYEVEKSMNGTDFYLVNTSKLNGLNNSAGNYRWIDQLPITGNNFYRIKMIGVDGHFQYSATVKVTIANNLQQITVSTTQPATGNINLTFNNMPAGIYQAKLLNMQGQLMHIQKIQHPEGTVIEKIESGRAKAGAMYMLEIIGPDKNKVSYKILLH